MVIKSLAQTLKDLATGIKNTITGVTGSNATLTIIKGNGTTSTVTVNNVANATNATKATQDSAGQQINTTYIKGLSISGKTITYTKGDSTTGTITTQDTTYTHPNSGVTAGTYKSVTVNAQGHVTAGSNPTTLAGYGITDASLKGHTHSQYLTASSDLNVNKLKGVVSLDNLPAGALERLVKVTNDTARFALTTNDIQLGDTVKVESTKMMYIVKDITKLNSEDGYEQYTAGMASSVPWSGVTGKPSSYTPSAHTHDDRYYTESEINSKVNTINSSIGTKADKTHTHDDRYYTESEMNTKLAGKSDTAHTHDDRYYTESEINTKLSGKSDTSHTHNYLPLAGGTTTGKVNMKSANLDNLPQVFRTDGVNFAGIRFQNTNGYLGAIGITGNVNSVAQRLGSDGNLYPILDSSNYNNYAPTKTGGGASGTWGINVSGNSATATKATQDSAGQQINTTYIKDLSVSGKTITYTKGNGSTGTITTQDTVYTHPTTVGNKHIPSGGSSGQILRWSANGTAVWGADNNTTYSPATQSTNGLMSAADKKKLDGITTGANAYTHPNSGVTAGTYRSVTVNAQGHVTGGSNPTTLAGYGITDAPTKTGGGASGTWGINITGNAASATNADTVDGVHATSLFYDKGAWDADNWATTGIYEVKENRPTTVGYNYGQVISSSSGGSRFQLYVAHLYNYDGRLHYRTGWDGDKQPWNTILDSENYNLFTPTKTGGGASGTWGISISGKANTAGTADTSKACSGNSASATKLATARNFKVNLASTGAASFNGTADATPGVTGTLPIANGGTGATTAAAARSNLGITCANIGAASASHTHGYVPLTGGTITGTLVINSPNVNNFNEGIRLTRAYNGWVGITFGSTGDAGRPEGGWFAATNPQGQFIISPDDSGNTNGLTLNKNGALLWRNTQISLNGHTHGAVTDSASGLMTAAQKKKLDSLSNYSLPAASSSTLGGIKMSYGTNDLSAGSSSLATGALYFVYE